MCTCCLTMCVSMLLDHVCACCPGLTLENYVQEEVGNASVEVLAGVVKVELAGQAINYTLSPGERLMVKLQ